MPVQQQRIPAPGFGFQLGLPCARATAVPPPPLCRAPPALPPPAPLLASLLSASARPGASILHACSRLCTTAAARAPVPLVPVPPTPPPPPPTHPPHPHTHTHTHHPTPPTPTHTPPPPMLGFSRLRAAPILSRTQPRFPLCCEASALHPFAHLSGPLHNCQLCVIQFLPPQPSTCLACLPRTAPRLPSPSPRPCVHALTPSPALRPAQCLPHSRHNTRNITLLKK